MIIGELDLDWAEQDPGYLARVKAFLVSARQVPAPLPRLPPMPCGVPDGANPDLAVE